MLRGLLRVFNNLAGISLSLELFDGLHKKVKVKSFRMQGDYHVHGLKYKHAPQICHSYLVLHHISAIKAPLNSI